MKTHLFDGYIRNRVQLCEELSIPLPDSRKSDHLILEAGFRKWGCDVGNHIYGSFALAISDEKNGKLFCARDPLGIKPFYYGFDSDGEFRYGSNIDHVVGNTHREIDREALQRYLMLGYPAGEKTLYKGVMKLMPGHYLIFDGSKLLVRPYYALSFQPDFSRTEEQWVREFERVLKDVLADDVETLASGGSCSFLSSGVDSSYLLALSGARHAYGIGYGEQACNEAETAAETAKRLGAEFVETQVTSDMFFDAVPRVMQSAGQPLADASTVALLLGCEKVARNNTHCLSGEGADELFAGYHVYRRADELGWTGEPWHFGCSGIMEEDSARRLLMLDRSYPAEDLVRGVYEASESWEHLSRLQAIDCALWFEGDILLGANAAARASGLELLLPHADQRVVDVATRIPACLRLKDGCGKYILRKAAQSRLPHEIAFRRKIGFSVPICSWMRESRHRENLETMLLGGRCAQFFDVARVRRYWTSFLEGNDGVWQVVYALYAFLIWYRHCFFRSEAIEE